MENDANDISQIQRKEYLERLISLKDKDLIKVISGIRRAGKSTLFQLYIEWLKTVGNVSQEQIIFLNFEDMANYSLCEAQKLCEYIMNFAPKNTRTYIFLDEVQQVNEFQRAVDGLFVHKNFDIYITGSNAYFLSGELATLLSGRYIEIKILPLSFSEYIYALGGDKSDLQKKYLSYITNSSFPYALQLENQNDIHSYLEGIYNTILVKDILTRTGISDTALLNSVIAFIFDTIGNPISATNIANTLPSKGRKVSVHTIESYLEAMTNSFICYKVQRYDVKGKIILSTQAKYYVADIGLRYYLLGAKTSDRGHILENIVYLELVRRGFQIYVGKIYDVEVDFIAVKNGEEIYYQVAYSVLDDATLERELKPLNMIKNHNQKFLLTMDYEAVSHNGIKQQNVLEWLLEK